MTSKFEIRAGLAGTILMAMNGNLSNSTSVATTEALCLSPSVNVNLTPRPKPTPDIAKFVKEEHTIWEAEDPIFLENEPTIGEEEPTFGEEEPTIGEEERKHRRNELFIEDVVGELGHESESLGVSDFWSLLSRKLAPTSKIYKCISYTVPFCPIFFREEIVFRSIDTPPEGWPKEISVSLRRNEVAFTFQYSSARFLSGYFKKALYPVLPELIENIKRCKVTPE
eukprot:GHVP01013531.1.p1 GENE.GHVP01013531.1~~GHVP01013531.1.p1  ORF type:complete len:238 (+),score=40.64 GHVP01013531.1:41-715(+)